MSADVFQVLADLHRELGRWPNVDEYAARVGADPDSQTAEALGALREAHGLLADAIAARRDWTDTNWSHELGTERLRVLHDALGLLIMRSGGTLARQLRDEAGRDLVARQRWWDSDDRQAEPWWPLTDLEHAQLGRRA